MHRSKRLISVLCTATSCGAAAAAVAYQVVDSPRRGHVACLVIISFTLFDDHCKPVLPANLDMTGRNGD